MPRTFFIAGTFLLFAGIALGVWAQPPSASTTKAAPRSSTAGDEEQIRQAVVKFVELYNAHRAEDLAALYATDARFVFRDGEEVNGRKAIGETFAAEFAESPKSAVSVVVESLRFLTPEVAVEEGFTSFFPDGDTLVARSRYTVLHLKKEGQWTMQSTRIVEEESLSAYDDLRPLEWLIGNWIDEGRDENVETTIRWDDNKSFLIEEFSVVREGKVVLKGTQRIGWDPQAKQIRSWIFDNAGGFGEAKWTPVGDEWVSNANNVLADGSSASATRILRKVNDNRAIWSSTNRMLGSETLPDITVTMVRKPPSATPEKQ